MLKFYAIGNTFSGQVHTEYLSPHELASYDVFPQMVVKPLGVDESTLAVRYRVVSGEIVDQYPGQSDEQVLQAVKLATTVDVTTIGAVKKDKIAKIRHHFDNVINGIKSDAATYEVATWDTQRIEYAAWVSDKAASTPYVDALAQGRGIERDVLMGKIGAKVAGMATLQGMQHALEERVEKATTVEEVDAIELTVL